MMVIANYVLDILLIVMVLVNCDVNSLVKVMAMFFAHYRTVTFP